MSDVNENTANHNKPNKRATSLKKIEANRRNAQRSTGPKTARGKTASKWNALTHGLVTTEIPIPFAPEVEDPGEFRELLAALRDDLQPAGVLEEILVEKIAACYWRYRRVLRCEAGELQRSLTEIDDDLQKKDNVRQILHKPPIEERHLWKFVESLRRLIPENLKMQNMLRYEAMIERELSRAVRLLTALRSERAVEMAQKINKITERSQKAAVAQ